MNKLFWILVAICFVGAAALWWMLGVVEQNIETHEEGAMGKTLDLEKGQASGEKKLSELSSLKKAVNAHFLELFTEPVGASVYVDEEFRGKTPLKLELEKKSYALIIKSAGFEDYQRELPSAQDVEGDLIWKVQMKELSIDKKEVALSEAAEEKDNENAEERPVTREKLSKKIENKGDHVTPQKNLPKINKSNPVAQKTLEPKNSPKNSLKTRFRRGVYNKNFIQIRSIKLDEFKETALKDESQWFRSDYVPFACRVDLGEKGQWARILLGPFENQLIARAALLENRAKLPSDAYVSGRQKCL